MWGALRRIRENDSLRPSRFWYVQEAVQKTGANASVIYCSCSFRGRSILEAMMLTFLSLSCITKEFLSWIWSGSSVLTGSSTRLMAPIVQHYYPGECKIGIMPGYIHQARPCGDCVSFRTLTYEGCANDAVGPRAIYLYWYRGRSGQCTSVSIVLNALPSRSRDAFWSWWCRRNWGTAEEEAAAFLKSCKIPKPVVGFIAGLHGPPGRRMAMQERVYFGSQRGSAW